MDAVLSRDGDSWCILSGGDLQEGVAGFGNTISRALSNYRGAFRDA